MSALGRRTEAATKASARARSFSRPLFSLDSAARFARAHAMVGQIVEIDVDTLRDGNVSTEEGTLVAVALSIGSGSDVAVLLRDGSHYPIAISLAQIRAIRNPERASS